MSVETLLRAKGEAAMARARFFATLGEAQSRLRPGNLAGEAWTGVKDKAADAADNAVAAVKQRPTMAALAVGGLALFLARRPLVRAAAKLVSRRRRQGNQDGD